MPLASMFNAPVPTLEVPRFKALPFVKETALFPELLSETAPVKALACVNVMALAPVVKLEVPPTVKIPFCVSAPELIVKF